MQIHKSVNVTTLCSMFNDMQNYPNMTHISQKLSIIYILIISKYDISTINWIYYAVHQEYEILLILVQLLYI